MIVRRPFAHLEADPVAARFVPFAVVVEDVLTEAECAALIARVEELGPSQATVNLPGGDRLVPGLRNNDRVIFDDVALAAELWGRLSPAARGGTRLNERFRAYRYAPGQHFAPHTDGAIRVGDEQSTTTVLLYLNGDCEGGETRFCDWGVTVKPRRGMALLFDHFVLHEGCPVLGGRKYVLRSDVMAPRG